MFFPFIWSTYFVFKRYFIGYDYGKHKFLWFFRRFIFSTNHREIGYLYLIFGAFAGVVGFFLSVLIRFELSNCGSNYFASNFQLYNSVVTLHGLVMIFFMVMPLLIG